MKSRYSKKIINSGLYGTINVSSGSTGLSNSGQGYIWAPYIMAQKIELISEDIPKRKREERKKKLDRIFKDNI